MHVAFVAFLISLVGSIVADNSQEPLHSPPTSPLRPHRIAIIGAGPGGSATSYYLDEFARSSFLPVEITVFDSNPYIGGRTTTVNALDDPRYPTELGASIFVKINHILYNATRDFGLTPSAKIYQAAPDSKYDLGIWDGSEFVFTSATEDDNTSSWRGWWDVAKLLWKYGLSPIRTQRATRKAVGSFLEFYEPPLFPFPSLQEVVYRTGLDAYTGITGKDALRAAGVGDLFSREIVQASTRVNYASNLGGIHGLETLVCMAIEGAVAVDGGNWQIFHDMVTSSASRLRLNTTVTDVVKHADRGTYTLQTAYPDDVYGSIEDNTSYDTVVLAAPYQFANISFTPPLAVPPAKIPYVSLHVTLLTSPHRLSPSFFGLDTHADVPSSVLTTLREDLDDDLGSRRGVDAVGPAGFWSVSTLRVLNPNTDGTFFGPTTRNHSTTTTPPQPQYLYKIFSPAPLTGTFLSRLLDFPHTPDKKDDPLSALSKTDVTWLHEKLWHSYPYELPRRTFENFTLLTATGDDHDRDRDPSLFYLSGMETFISTMETSALAGMNVARLIVDQLQSQQQA